MWSDRVCSGNGSATAASLLQRAPAARITFTTRAASPEVLALLGLEARGADRFGEYSFGMKQRLPPSPTPSLSSCSARSPA
jgi:hypothetical protein